MVKSFGVEGEGNEFRVVTIISQGDTIISKTYGNKTYRGYAFDELKILLAKEMVEGK